MALFDYGNTRLRARISRQFSISMLESFSDLTTIDSFISTLTKTAYKESLESALTFAHGYACVTLAMQSEMGKIYDDLHLFYQDEVRKLIEVIFIRDDLESMKAIVRGLAHHSPLDSIINSFPPLGSISRVILTKLASSKDLDEAITKSAIFNLPVAEPLMNLRAKKDQLNSSEVELVLENWYFSMVADNLKGNSENINLLREFYAIEADITNLNTLLRVISIPENLDKLELDFQDYLVADGNIKKDIFIKLLATTSVEKMIYGLLSTKYGGYLRKGLSCFRETKNLSEFENQMRMYMLNWLARLPRQYPLGIGVPLGYVARKKSEVRNLRWIANGIETGFEATYIKENLERVG